MRLENWFFAVPQASNRIVNVRDPSEGELYVMGDLYGDPKIKDGTPMRTSRVEEFTILGIYTDDDLHYQLGTPHPAFARDFPDSIRTLHAYQEELRNKGN